LTSQVPGRAACGGCPGTDLAQTELKRPAWAAGGPISRHPCRTTNILRHGTRTARSAAPSGPSARWIWSGHRRPRISMPAPSSTSTVAAGPSRCWSRKRRRLRLALLRLPLSRVLTLPVGRVSSRRSGTAGSPGAPRAYGHSCSPWSRRRCRPP
jgi:hypothetical protein